MSSSSSSINNETAPCRPCQCRGRGTTEYCIKDSSHVLTGLEAGDCICKKGFQGKYCDSCAPGYRNYPRCDSCHCNGAGVVNPEACDGPTCVCKANVEGNRCDRCKAGYFDLSADNPDGCAPCFCFGATSSCKSSDWGVEVISSLAHLEAWKVSDFSGKKVVTPTRKSEHLVIADDDMQPMSSPYYWMAPDSYLGEKLYSYGGDLRFMIGYTVLRGDTSGYYTEDADIILDGGPETVMRIGYNWKRYDKNENEDKVTLTLPLRENGWYILDGDGRRVRPVSREEFTLVLYNLRNMLIRAKFHTDQIEGSMYNVEMEQASKDSKSLNKQTGAESCDCPEGYMGLSCLECAPGYRRVNNILVGGRCEKCNCNNHAESCDPFTGECSECLHNTEGAGCSKCKKGYYGDPTRGTPEDCKPCACPLTLSSNNFSPTCVLTEKGDDYICDACIEPYAGDKCEICKQGYYGDPSVPGGECLPCECGPNVDTSVVGGCDSRTGQCRCAANTTGWKCDQCLPHHWGNPSLGDCKPCNCDLSGSNDPQCDPKTGQCSCKPNFTGRLCDRCAVGHGNPELGCPACNCNGIGSSSSDCDPITGQCHCKPGIFGQHCSHCLEGYYGFSVRGCLPCDCHPKGSEGKSCDEISGQCK